MPLRPRVMSTRSASFYIGSSRACGLTTFRRCEPARMDVRSVSRIRRDRVRTLSARCNRARGRRTGDCRTGTRAQHFPGAFATSPGRRHRCDRHAGVRKEPQHRYSSVERLVADIRHYLDNEPVQARQGNWVYYTQRFVRRHTTAVVASVGFLIFLTGVAIIMSIQRQSIAAALERATHDRERAEQVRTSCSTFSARPIHSSIRVRNRRHVLCWMKQRETFR